MKAIVIEDEKKTAEYLRKGLSEHGFVVDVAENGEDGLHLASTGDYALIILDVMMPHKDGWSVMRELKKIGEPDPCTLSHRQGCPRRQGKRS